MLCRAEGLLRHKKMPIVQHDLRNLSWTLLPRFGQIAFFCVATALLPYIASGEGGPTSSAIVFYDMFQKLWNLLGFYREALNGALQVWWNFFLPFLNFLPGLAWVLLNCVLRTILCTLVHRDSSPFNAMKVQLGNNDVPQYSSSTSLVNLSSVSKLRHLGGEGCKKCKREV